MGERFRLATAAASFRANTEDRLAVHEVDDRFVVVVADGAGGIPGGAAAAEHLLKAVVATLNDPAFRLDAEGSWVNVLRRADDEVQAVSTAGETTAVIVCVSPAGLVGATVGDSGAIVVMEDGTVQDLTADQLPHRKRRIGSGRAVPTAFEGVLPSGAVLMVVTDGVLAYARHDQLARAVLAAEDLDQAASNVIDVVRLPSGDLMDDIAVVLVRRR